MITDVETNSRLIEAARIKAATPSVRLYEFPTGELITQLANALEQAEAENERLKVGKKPWEAGSNEKFVGMENRLDEAVELLRNWEFETDPPVRDFLAKIEGAK